MYEQVNGELPKILKLIMVFIDRVGFPVLAFILMFYFAFISINKVTAAITETTKAFTSFSASTVEVQRTMLANQTIIMQDLKSIMLNKNIAIK